MKKEEVKKLEKWLEKNDKRVAKCLVKEWGFDPEWVKKSHKKIKKNRRL